MARDKRVHPVTRFAAALLILTIATLAAGLLASLLYNGLLVGGNTNSSANQIAGPVFVGIWILLMFIGYRVSQRVLRR